MYPKLNVGDCGGEKRDRYLPQYPMPNALKIYWRFWGFGSHGLVVTMINIYLYRGRDYGINI
ncbi:MAG: hypothetical protein HWQ38_00110 [Nostoc sp. NMS7]|uniref:hypothetical protein n=1 Tax=Nostoc sp. NMS7 TaxID=2815391 RepID=UPI0025E5328F|nr:hypothetical protein [Nostoc sp. NMS7]MBN3944967.1 hypothetical protein [Nostoc sp. NMS7]